MDQFAAVVVLRIPLEAVVVPALSKQLDRVKSVATLLRHAQIYTVTCSSRSANIFQTQLGLVHSNLGPDTARYCNRNLETMVNIYTCYTKQKHIVMKYYVFNPDLIPIIVI